MIKRFYFGDIVLYIVFDHTLIAHLVTPFCQQIAAVHPPPQTDSTRLAPGLLGSCGIRVHG